MQADTTEPQDDGVGVLLSFCAINYHSCPYRQSEELLKWIVCGKCSEDYRETKGKLESGSLLKQRFYSRFEKCKRQKGDTYISCHVRIMNIFT